MDKIKKKFKSFFSTPKKAVISTLVIVAAVAVLGTGAAFASVYWDMNEDRVEYAIRDKLSGGSATDPADSSTADDGWDTDPADGASVPEGGATDPADGASVPEGGATDPADEGTAPEGGATDPADGGTVPEDGATDPADSVAQAAEKNAKRDIAGDSNQATANAKQKISAKEAEDIALADAGLTRKEISGIYSHYEWDDGFYEYEIQFFKGDTEYEYTVGAEDGEIYEVDADWLYD